MSAQKKPQVDEDIIPAEQKESAKREASAHLTRQAGKGTASQPKNKDDSGEEAQNEFQAQMERQKKQAGHGEEKVAEDKDEKEGTELKKQAPKKAEEDPKSKAASEKGPGW